MTQRLPALLTFAALAILTSVWGADAGVRLVPIGDTTFGNIPQFVESAALSPDGAHLYVGTRNRVVIFSRDGGTGLLSVVGSFNPFYDSLNGFGFSPGGEHVYLATDFGGIDIYSRDAGTGQLTEIGYDDVNNVHDALVTPDGAYVYATSYGDWYIAVRARNPVTGALTFVENQSGGLNAFTGLFNPEKIVLSPDGAYLYLTASASFNGSGGVAVYARNAGTGQLTHIQTLTKDAVPQFEQVTGIAMSPDGKNVYVTSTVVPDGLVAFSRDAGTGMLTPIQVVEDGKNGAYGMLYVHGVGVSHDGTRVYVTGEGGTIVLSRDPATGLLTFRHAEPVPASVDPILVSPDDRQVYVPAGYSPLFVRAYSPARLCTSTPIGTCRAAPKSKLLVKEFTDPKHDKVIYKWINGEDTQFTDLGDPIHGSTNFAVCLYTEGMSGQELSADLNAPTGNECGRDQCWNFYGPLSGATSLAYKDPAVNPDGIQKLQFKPGGTGHAKILLVAKSALLPPLPTVPVPLPITVQVQQSDGGCWTSTFMAADVEQIPGDPALLKGNVR